MGGMFRLASLGVVEAKECDVPVDVVLSESERAVRKKKNTDRDRIPLNGIDYKRRRAGMNQVRRQSSKWSNKLTNLIISTHRSKAENNKLRKQYIARSLPAYFKVLKGAERDRPLHSYSSSRGERCVMFKEASHMRNGHMGEQVWKLMSCLVMKVMILDPLLSGHWSQGWSPALHKVACGMTCLP